MTRYVKIVVEYDGTDFAGWQVQPDQRTVQEEVEKALFELTGSKIRITGAGRTDSGVHALGQVVSFQEKSGLPVDAYRFGLNRFLPVDIRVTDGVLMNTRFDARRHAKERIYRYVISRRLRAVGRQYAWYPNFSFDLESMKDASRYLLGEHDFTSFCKAQEDEDKPVSIVYDIIWKETVDEVVFDIKAVKYFHNMIRIIIGTLLEIGRGKMTPEEFGEILDTKDRNQAGPTAPATGLFLVEVKY